MKKYSVKKIWRYPSRLVFFRLDDRLLLIVLGALVGVCSGLASVALNHGLSALSDILQSCRSLWWAFFLPGIGAVLSFLFLEKVVREGAGHGVPEVVYSVSRYGGLMRFRSSFSRLISSWLTIGSGGSAGPEAPVVMSGAAIGSNIARFFSLNERQRVALVGCGTAGALAGIFNAPITGMVFTIEIIMGDWSAVNVVPIAIASVAGAQVSRLLSGDQIQFTHLKFAIDMTSIFLSIGLAVVTAAVSVLLTRCLVASHDIAGRIFLPFWIKAAVGGCLVGLIGLARPEVLGEGYHFIQKMVEGGFPAGLFLVTLLVAAKIIATSLTLGWGGSGGIFAPCLVIGSFTGLMCHRSIMALWPGLTSINEGCFALLGMSGLISGILQAPMTGIFLIVEITGGYETILPLIIVSAISTTLTHAFEPASYYLRDLISSGQYMRPRTDARVLSDLSIRELVETDCITVHRSMKLGDFVKVVQESHRNYFPVADEKSGKFVGMIHLDDIRPYLFDPLLYEAVFLEQIMRADPDTVDIADELSEVLDRMDKRRLYSMPVVSGDRFVGMVSKATLLDRYRHELMVQS
ncbi:MAG: chloride channel protein [Deltaproteobacteria bacterium]|nr:chloride channel protein [Deltaproteobacteria bacterium]